MKLWDLLKIHGSENSNFKIRIIDAESLDLIETLTNRQQPSCYNDWNVVMWNLESEYRVIDIYVCKNYERYLSDLKYGDVFQYDGWTYYKALKYIYNEAFNARNLNTSDWVRIDESTIVSYLPDLTKQLKERLKK